MAFQCGSPERGPDRASRRGPVARDTYVIRIHRGIREWRSKAVRQGFQECPEIRRHAARLDRGPGLRTTRTRVLRPAANSRSLSRDPGSLTMVNRAGGLECAARGHWASRSHFATRRADYVRPSTSRHRSSPACRHPAFVAPLLPQAAVARCRGGERSKRPATEHAAKGDPRAGPPTNTRAVPRHREPSLRRATASHGEAVHKTVICSSEAGRLRWAGITSQWPAVLRCQRGRPDMPGCSGWRRPATDLQRSGRAAERNGRSSL